MPREAVFTRETRLWHRDSGWQTFPAGESNPGPAWSELEGGAVLDGKRDAATMKELAELTARAEKAEHQLASATHDRAALSQKAEDANRKASGLEARAKAAEKALAETEADKLRIAAERDQAREVEAGLRNEVAALKASAKAGEDALAEANRKAAGRDADRVRIMELETDLANARAGSSKSKVGV